MDPHCFGRTGRSPFLASVLEGANQLLLFGVNRDCRLIGLDCLLHSSGDMLELRVTVDVTGPLKCLTIA